MTFDELRAAGKNDPVWYANNNVDPTRNFPEKKLPGGGVLAEDLTDYETALARCIEYTKERITEAERHLRHLQAETTASSSPT